MNRFLVIFILIFPLLAEASPPAPVRVDCVQKKKLRVDLGKDFQTECALTNVGKGFLILEQVKSADSRCRWVYEPSEKSRAPIPGGAKVSVRISCNLNAVGTFTRDLMFQVREGNLSQVTMASVNGTVRTKAESENERIASADERTAIARVTNCRPVRLDQKGNSMAHVPVSKQKLSNCYAAVSAQLYDAFRFVSGDSRTNFLTSRMDITVRNSKRKNDVAMKTGGTIGRSLAELLEKPPCAVPKEDLINDDIARSGGYSARLRDRMSRTDKDNIKIFELENGTGLEPSEKVARDFSDSLKAIRKDYANYLVSPSSPHYMQRANRGRMAIAVCVNNVSLPLADTVSAQEMIALIQSDDVLTLLEKSLSLKCDDSERLALKKKFRILDSHMPLDGSGIGADLNSWQSKTFDQIQSQLNGGKLATPVALGMCSTVLTAYTSSKGSVMPDSEECGPHAVLVIGQRLDRKTNRCEFLVRNSWGSKVGDYSKPWKEEVGKGNVWIDAEVLARNTFHSTRIK